MGFHEFKQQMKFSAEKKTEKEMTIGHWMSMETFQVLTISTFHSIQ